MTIRQHERVLYEHTPLVEVICQLSFADAGPLTPERIDAFREAGIGSEYPNYQEQKFTSIEFPVAPHTAESETASSELPVRNSVSTSHNFVDADGIWRVALSSTDLAVACARYSRWEDFQRRVFAALDAYERAYGPPSFVKIGLRYKDVIEREPIGLAGVAWHELLAPFVTGCLGAQALFSDDYNIAGGVEQQNSQSLFTLARNKVLLQTALLHAVDKPKQQAFLIDADFFVDALADVGFTRSGLDGVLEELHANAGALFRNCIQEKLHVALKPRPI